jgi:hypothetical protein
MHFYNQQHRFYCGIDPHARSMFTHILDDKGKTVFEQDLPACPDAFRHAVTPFRNGLVVGCECMFAWYWLADLCVVNPAFTRRGCISQPRVALRALWEDRPARSPTPKGLHNRGRGLVEPFQGRRKFGTNRFPKVGEARPWAMGWNPFGVKSKPKSAAR